MANIILLLSILVITVSVVHGRNIFQDSDHSDLIRLGSRLVTESRTKRTLDNNDRGAQNVYYVSRTPSVWGTAWLTCRQAMNGQLLTIETEAEDLFIRDLLIENDIASVWTSGAFDPELGIWRWVATGGEILYANWLRDQPSSSDATARIAIQNSLFSHGWNTVAEDATGHYICEVRSEPIEQPTPSTPSTTEVVTEATTEAVTEPPPPTD